MASRVSRRLRLPHTPTALKQHSASVSGCTSRASSTRCLVVQTRKRAHLNAPSHKLWLQIVSFRQGRGKAAHDYSAVGGFVFCSSKGNSLECRSILHKDIYFFSRRFSSLEIAPISPTLVGSGWRKKATRTSSFPGEAATIPIASIDESRFGFGGPVRRAVVDRP